MVRDRRQDVLDVRGVCHYYYHLNHPINYCPQSHEEGIHWLMSFVGEETVKIVA